MRRREQMRSIKRLLRLFQVVVAGKDTQYFGVKAAAKRYRDEQIALGNTVKLERGPDHWKEGGIIHA